MVNPEVVASWPVVRSGSRVAVISPSSPLDADALRNGCHRLSQWGLSPMLGQHIGVDLGEAMVAGSDLDRAADLQWALTAPDIEAVFVGRGGYGLLRILHLMDWALIRSARPRPIVGLSDVTCLHEALRVHTTWPTLMGPHVCGALSQPEADEATLDSLRVALFEGHASQPTHWLTNDSITIETVRAGYAFAPIHGGNLAMLAAMAGSVEGRPPAGPFIAALEDVNEAPYRVDRMLTQLIRSGWFRNACGVISGEWINCGEVLDVISERLTFVPGPFIHAAPFGHGDRHLTIALGVPTELAVPETST
jgi:muramoyltetrapeptide carboxypeptidase